MRYLSVPIQNKYLLWFQSSHKFLCVNKETYQLFIECIERQDLSFMRSYCLDTLLLTNKQTDHLIGIIVFLFSTIDYTKDADVIGNYDKVPLRKSLKTMCYRFGEVITKICYSNAIIFDQIHPKFSHLSIDRTDQTITDLIHLSYHNNHYSIYFNHRLVGCWHKSNSNEFMGKLSMVLLNSFYKTQTEDWAATFHGSSIYKKNDAFTFIGDSGAGKSTAVSILVANGYHLLADDFVPMSSQGQLCCFPAALSIKSSNRINFNALFSDASWSKERVKIDKINYKYLYHQNSSSPNISIKKKCKVIIHIKYKEKTKGSYKVLRAKELLELLIPQAWLSRDPSNVKMFMKSISTCKCYTLIYSEPNDLVSIIRQIESNDL